MNAGRLSSSFVQTIFFGNYFYGLCTVALSTEAGLQQEYGVNSISYYVMVFIATVLYYTRAYLPSKSIHSSNPRTRWYAGNKPVIIRSQWVLALLLVITGCGYVYRYYEGILHLPLLNWILMALFPLVAIFYYGIGHRFFSNYNLRSIGWLKPFIIGIIWAGMVTVYPIIFYGIENGGQYYHFNITGTFLFIKNLMFVTVLCIMFDIKDYADDSNHQIKTFVVNVGLRKTLFSIVLPLSVLGLASFLVVAFVRQFSELKILMNLLPFLALLVVAYSMHKRQSIFYYLMAIDGLMLVKGICGSIGMLFF